MTNDDDTPTQDDTTTADDAPIAPGDPSPHGELDLRPETPADAEPETPIRLITFAPVPYESPPPTDEPWRSLPPFEKIRLGLTRLKPLKQRRFPDWY